MGGRILNNSDKAFVPINYTTGQFAFRAGFKVFNFTFENEFPIVQSAQSPSAFNVTLMDNSFVTPNGATNIGLSAFQFANISQPAAADLKPTFRWFDQVTFGARDYIFTNPQNYIINPMSNYTRAGVVASIQLVKMLDGWALAYSVSVNTQDAIA
jgi:hypothetical protein